MEGKIKRVKSIEHHVDIFKYLYTETDKKLEVAIVKKFELIQAVEKLELQLHEALVDKETAE